MFWGKTSLPDAAIIYFINVIFGISAVQNLTKDTFIFKIANFDEKLAKFGNFDPKMAKFCYQISQKL